MPLVTFNDILPQARAEKRAVAAFNVANLETVLSVFKAAEALKAPVIIQVYQRLFKDERAGLIAAMVTRLASESDIPVALHLDHGESLEQLRAAIAIGYTSVMIDGSKLSFAENIALSAEAARIAHDAGVTLEAEIGHVPFGDGAIELSTAAEAEAFVAKTGVDALAISIGTVHGFYKKAPVLDIGARGRSARKSASRLFCTAAPASLKTSCGSLSATAWLRSTLPPSCRACSSNASRPNSRPAVTHSNPLTCASSRSRRTSRPTSAPRSAA